MASGKTFEDLDLSREEIKRIETALKDEKFRKMFVEYAEEISNPENRKRYEEEIAQMENERGMDVQFVNPKPGHVLKTVDDSGNKVFLNICTSDKLGTPSSTKQTDASGNRGLHWQIPHSFSPPREEFDKNKQTCMVYDVVFHPDTYRMSTNPRFKKMVEDTALEGIQKQFGIKLDYNNIKRPKMGYKGQPVATVIRSRKDESDEKVKQEQITSENDPLTGMPYPYENKTSAELAEEKRKQVEKMSKEKKTKEDKTKFNSEKKTEDDGYTIPVYTITHRSNLELQEFTNAPDSKPTTRPVELIINIQLPLCKSAAGVDLDIFEDKLTLKSEKPAYKLDLKLPYNVEDENGTAKFDKSKKSLIITLPVVVAEIPKMPSFIENPSEVNSDIPPLIEELPPLEEIHQETNPTVDELPPLEDVEEDNQIPSHKPEQKSETVKKISYSLPQYDFSQDIETVTFTFHVKNIDEESVSKSFPMEGACDIKFTSLGSGGFPWHCALFIKFQDGVKLVPEHSSIDISEKNMTLTLLKSRQNRTMWDKFSAGLNEDSLEEKLFLTTANLSSQLEELKTEGEQLAQTETQTEQDVDAKPRLHVSEMNKKKLTIKIGEKPKAGYCYADEEEISDDDCPNSADIQVVHSKVLPDLHGILKQRSMSESSEDRASFSSESPSVSPRDSETPKHVHFNSHIDKTTYKSNMAVSSMKQALKSKRRRNRKREEKMAERNSRRRHNSNGSEYSSSDEHDHRLSSCESHSEDDHDIDELSNMIEATGKKVEDCGVIAEAGELEETADVTKDTDKAVTEKTTENRGKGGKQGGKKVSIAEQVKSKMAEGKGTEAVNSDDEDDVEEISASDDNKQQTVRDENALKVVDRTSDLKKSGKSGEKGGSGESQKIQGKSVAATENNKDGEVQSGNTGAMAEDLPQANELKPANLVNVIKEEDGMHEKGGSGDGCESDTKEGEKSAVETDLSWKDGEKVEPQNEHRTECAFKFSNAVMYDLDID